MIRGEPEKLGISSDRLQRLTEAMQAGVERREIPGAVIVIARKGEIAYFETFGYRDREASAPMREDAIFRIDSLTKPVTSLAAMMLVEEGKLTLTSPASLYLPQLSDLKVGVETPDGDLKLETPRGTATVLDLLRHTSGFTTGSLGFGDSAVKQLYRSSGLDDPNVSASEFIAKLAALPLQFHPGAAWGYGRSTDVLGHIVEVVAGVRLDEFIKTRITDPLRMTASGFVVGEPQRDRLAEPHVDPASGKRPPMRDVTYPPVRISGNGGMVSTALDYARFCQFWLNHGELDGVRLLSRKSVELMTANYLPPDIAFDPDTAATFGPALPSPAFGYGFGLGFAVRTHMGRGPWHGSIGDLWWVGSAGPIFWIDPQEQLFAILMMQAPTQLVPYIYLVRTLVYQALKD